MKIISKIILTFFLIIIVGNIAISIFSHLIYKYSVNRIDEINIPYFSLINGAIYDENNKVIARMLSPNNENNNFYSISEVSYPDKILISIVLKEPILLDNGNMYKIPDDIYKNLSYKDVYYPYKIINNKFCYAIPKDNKIVIKSWNPITDERKTEHSLSLPVGLSNDAIDDFDIYDNTIAVSVYSGYIYIMKDKKLLKQFIEMEAKRITLSSNKVAIYSIDRILIRSLEDNISHYVNVPEILHAIGTIGKYDGVSFIEDDLFIRYKYWVNNKMNYNSYVAKSIENGYKLYRIPSRNCIYPYK